ncbi:MAG: 4Fe-4S binding protein [Desulfobacterales bacterium]|jgi:formate hydrogenlyase subunit 6/NADH:ubiquinone oxidoreductase subunit I|nr:4Fe-4S binding protein [Desulfobacterales bacterium]
MNKNKKKPIPRFNREVCIACTMCVDVCPVGVLDLVISNSPSGFRRYPMLASAHNCTGCASCEKQCPAGAITMIEQEF